MVVSLFEKYRFSNNNFLAIPVTLGFFLLCLLFVLIFFILTLLLLLFFFLSFAFTLFFAFFLFLGELRRGVDPGHYAAEKNQSLFFLKLACFQRLDYVVNLFKIV